MKDVTRTDVTPTIGFVGLGLMGRLMAANLEKAGHSVQSFDINGSGNCRSARAAATGAQILITMLPDGKAVRHAVLAALPGLAPGSIVIDMSSSDPGDTKKLHEILKVKKISLLDAPVSGAKGEGRRWHAGNHGRRRTRGARTCAPGARQTWHGDFSHRGARLGPRHQGAQQLPRRRSHRNLQVPRGTGQD